ncbi:hypothetical protein TRIP_E190235 [uncultured Spirochaetota bacterium]|nr:hypothetical protein TRIP_E190235 [uncultured Spirochaetota bacterium]
MGLYAQSSLNQGERVLFLSLVNQDRSRSGHSGAVRYGQFEKLLIKPEVNLWIRSSHEPLFGKDTGSRETDRALCP